MNNIFKKRKWTEEQEKWLIEHKNICGKMLMFEEFKKAFPDAPYTANAISSKRNELRAFNKHCNYTKRQKPLYSEQIKKGYVRIKIAQPDVWWQKQKWVYLETHPWEVKNINETDVFIFLDGDNRNFAPNNIERLERKLQPAFIRCGGVIKGNATLSRINLARAKLTVSMLDAGEKIGICGRTGSNGRYFKERMNELARKYRAEKKRKKCLR